MLCFQILKTTVPHGSTLKKIGQTGVNNPVQTITLNKRKMTDIHVPTMAELAAKGEAPDILFWVGCMGSYDERAQRITKDLCKILQHVGLKYAILGKEESCTGDPAKRAGNEFLFQMQAMNKIGRTHV